MEKEKVNAYKECLELIKAVIRDHGRGNIVYKSELEEIRDAIFGLIEKEEEKELKNEQSSIQNKA